MDASTTNSRRPGKLASTVLVAVALAVGVSISALTADTPAPVEADNDKGGTYYRTIMG